MVKEADHENNTIRQAMVLAAGMGNRMRPITDQIPKPLVKVYGKALLDHGLDALQNAQVDKAVVNVHYLADQIEMHLENRDQPEIIVSSERDGLLDSGGGIKKALGHFNDAPFFILNADSFWLEGANANLATLANHWNCEEMDFLLLLASMDQAVGYEGRGDFDMDPEGRLTRRDEQHVAAFAYCGAAIVHPRIFNNSPDTAFSLNLLFDRAIENNRLFGMRMEGIWLHVGTPQAISEAEEAIARSAA